MSGPVRNIPAAIVSDDLAEYLGEPLHVWEFGSNPPARVGLSPFFKDLECHASGFLLHQVEGGDPFQKVTLRHPAHPCEVSPPFPLMGGEHLRNTQVESGLEGPEMDGDQVLMDALAELIERCPFGAAHPSRGRKVQRNVVHKEWMTELGFVDEEIPRQDHDAKDTGAHEVRSR